MDARGQDGDAMHKILVRLLQWSMVVLPVPIVAVAQTPGSFATTGSMVVSRERHTATLLPDGRVLITGGYSGVPLVHSQVVESAELYDPGTGTFRITGSMRTPRMSHTATLLPNGKVLIVGGYGPNTPEVLRSAELYDPETETFSPAGELEHPLARHEAVLLRTGKVFLGGGHTTVRPGGSVVAKAHLYDPTSGKFELVGEREEDFRCLYCAAATILQDGQVLMARSPYSRMELYDPQGGTFTALGSITQLSTATLLRTGQVLLAGGEDESYFSRAELYDPATQTLEWIGHMGWNRVRHTATLLADGSALIAGGGNDNCGDYPGFLCIVQSTLDTAEVYDPAIGEFTKTGKMIERRESHRATVLNDGTVLVTGGSLFAGMGRYLGTTQSAEVYHPAVTVPEPLLYALSQDGRGQGAILHGNSARIVSNLDPAVAGEVLEIYGAGLLEGSVLAPSVIIGGKVAEVLYFGKTSYEGMNQVNVSVPAGIGAGAAVSMRMTYMGRWSNEVTIGIR